jgi:hypothetical protein
MRQPRARVPRFVGTKKYKDRARPLPRDCFSLRLILASCELRMRGLWARSVRWKACAFPFPGPTSHNARGRSAGCHPRLRPARCEGSTCVLTLALRVALATTARRKVLRVRGFQRKWSVHPPATAPPFKYDMQRCVLPASLPRLGKTRVEGALIRCWTRTTHCCVRKCSWLGAWGRARIIGPS